MDPKTRLLKRVTVEDAAEADRVISMLMGGDAAPRDARAAPERAARRAALATWREVDEIEYMGEWEHDPTRSYAPPAAFAPAPSAALAATCSQAPTANHRPPARFRPIAARAPRARLQRYSVSLVGERDAEPHF